MQGAWQQEQKAERACHVLAGVVAHALNHGGRAAVAHGKALGGHAPKEGLALRVQSKSAPKRGLHEYTMHQGLRMEACRRDVSQCSV